MYAEYVAKQTGNIGVLIDANLSRKLSLPGIEDWIAATEEAPGTLGCDNWTLISFNFTDYQYQKN